MLTLEEMLLDKKSPLAKNLQSETLKSIVLLGVDFSILGIVLFNIVTVLEQALNSPSYLSFLENLDSNCLALKSLKSLDHGLDENEVGFFIQIKEVQ